MLYSYHTDDQYDVEEASFYDMSDSDDNDPFYANHTEVHKVLGKYREDGLNSKTFQSGLWIWLPL